MYPSQCTHWERTLGTGWVGPTASLEILDKQEKFVHLLGTTADCPACNEVTVSVECGILSLCALTVQCVGLLGNLLCHDTFTSACCSVWKVERQRVRRVGACCKTSSKCN